MTTIDSTEHSRDYSKQIAKETGLFKVDKVSLSENIAQQIMDSLATGDLKPSQKLPSERDLCKHFGVGRSTLREAIQCLAIVGILNVSAGNGTFVSANADKFLGKILQWVMVTEQDNIENLMAVRLALECASAIGAAECGTEEQFRKMELLLKKMQAAKDTPEHFVELDLQLHMLIAEASSNNLLFDLVLMIRRQLSMTILRFVRLRGGAALACKHHSALVRALKSRDSQAAVSIMQTHLAGSLERYRKSLIHQA